MSKSHNNRGFTLMELLVVMAIIGVLAAIVLTSLNTSRTKAADAAIKANLKNTIVQAQVFFDLGGGSGTDTYNDVCAVSGVRVIGQMVRSAENNYDGQTSAYADGTASTWDNAQCHDSLTAWAAWVPLRASANGTIVAWCTDSTGASKQVSAPLGANAMVCP